MIYTEPQILTRYLSLIYLNHFYNMHNAGALPTYKRGRDIRNETLTSALCALNTKGRKDIRKDSTIPRYTYSRLLFIRSWKSCEIIY